jgi:hypothetical protein
MSITLIVQSKQSPHMGVVTIKKGCWTMKKNNQNWTNIYVSPFKTMVIMASFSFFIHMNVKEFKPKIYFIKF